MDTEDSGLDAVRLAEDIKAILDRLDPRVRPLLQFVATNSETTDAELAAALGVAETLLSASAINRADRALDQLKHAVDKLAS